MDVNATHRQLVGWKFCQQHWSDACKKSAVSNAATAGQKFGVDYEAEARNGKLWIRYAGRHCTTQYDESCVWDPIGGNWSELVLKGVSWSGMHDKRTNCVEELGGFRYYRPMGEYIGALQAGHFNAVRLPLYASGVLDDPRVNEQRCGRLSHANNHEPVKRYNAALKSVTLWPAEILGIADQLGSLAAGKRASLIVTSGDPLEPMTQIQRVWIDGEEYDLARSKHRQLFERYKGRIQAEAE